MDELTYLLSGIVFGLTAGLSPGPLFTLVITETLRHGKAAGMKVALAPLFTDGLLIVAGLFLFSQLPNMDFLLGLLSLAGAVFVAYLAYESLTAKGVETDSKGSQSQSLQRAIVTNLLNPHPYLFYLLVGAPIIQKGLLLGLLSPGLFIAGFLSMLVGSKMVVALTVDRSRDFLKSTAYVYTMKVLGMVLLLFALNFAQEGLQFLGVMV